MPPKYLKIKKKMQKEGKSEAESEKSAARIFNAQRKPGQKPMGPWYDSKTKGFSKKKGR